MNSKKTCFPHKIGSVSSKISLLTLLAFALLLSPMVVYGATVTLAWDANTEPDLAGYKIYYRTPSGVFNSDDSVNVKEDSSGWSSGCGPVYDPFKTECCEYTLKDLEEGETYYLAAKAYDIDGNESAYSEELVHITEDATLPTVTITTPTSGSTYSTSQSQLSIGGTASDNVAVTLVSWSNSRGGSGTCSGTNSWSNSGIVLSSGQNVITVTAKDAAGNSGTDTLTVTYTPPDTTRPTVTITTPTSGSTYSTSQSQLSIGGTASDNVAITLVSWSNSRGGSGTCSGTNSWSNSGIVLSSGQNVITVTAKDAAGNSGTDTLTVTYTPPDTTRPTVTITTPTSGSTYSTSQSQLSIGGTASDTVAVTLVSWSNSRGGSGTCSGTNSWSNSGIVLSSGQNVITVTAKDAAGNSGTDTLTVTYTPPDTTRPTVTITTPTSGSTYSTSQSQLSIGGTASDTVAVTLVSWSNSRGGSGTCSGTNSWSNSGIVLSSGQNVITVTAKDAAGNSGTDTLTVTYTPPDTTRPTVTITTPTSGSTYSTSQSQLSIGGTASDNVAVTLVSWSNSRGGSGTCSGTNSWSNSGIVLSSGQNVITVTAKDAAGNSGTDTLTVTYTPPDTTRPTVTITTPTSGSTYSTSQSQLSIGGTASDTVAVTLVSWSNSRGGSGTCSGTNSWSNSGIVLSSGQNVITVTAKDAAGNSGTDTLTVTYTPPDTTRPTVTITTPTSGSTYSTSQSQLSIGGTASDTVAVTLVSWSNSRGGSGTCSGTNSWSNSGIVLSSGQNVITVTAKDAAGNSGTDTLTVTYTPPDTTRPTVTITTPTSGSTYSTSQSQLSIGGTASDNVAVTLVSWSNSRGGSGTCSGTNSWSNSGIVLSSGQNVITVTAKDAAGNSGTDTLTVTYTQQTGSLKVSIAPSGAVTAGAQWRVDGGIWRDSGATQSGLSVGSHTVEFKNVSGWIKPGNKTEIINANETTNAGGTYTRQTGSLKVSITPSEAVTAGAQWRVDGGIWRNSGATQSGLSIGSHTVEFKNVSGWIKPGNKSEIINANETTNAGGTYTRQTGSLKVSITPSEAVTAGAQWRVDGGIWRNSGATQSGLSIGSHTVEFKNVSGWIKPGNKTETINANETTNASGTYTPPDTTPPIEAEDMPIKTTGVPISGGWNIWDNGYIADNIDFAAGGTVSFEVMAMGSYAGGAWPIMEVRIDQTPVGTVAVDSSSWMAYTIQASITPGTHEVAIAFINDYWEDPDDRNLYVDKVTITTENSAPVSNAGDDQTVEEGETVTLSGLNSTDPDDNIVSYTWQQTGGKSVILSNSKGAETTFTAPNAVTDADTLTFRLTVKDAEGLQDIDDCIATVTRVAAVDSDGDGVPDDQDDFPYDPDEYLDTDGDGEGNNADTDDDNDGMPDTWELTYGLDPLKDEAAEDPDGDEVSNINEYNLGTKPNTNEGNFAPDPPQLLNPENHEIIGLTPLLETDEFYDPNINDVHSQTQWKIVRVYDEFCVFDVTTSSSLTTLKVPKLILEDDTDYSWQVKFIDNQGTASAWSEVGYFTTEFLETDLDGNGVLDHQEVDTTIDLDKDGIMDRDQQDIKSIATETGGFKIGISVREDENADSIISIQSEIPDDTDLLFSAQDGPNFLAFGLIHFKLLVKEPGDEVLVTIYLSKAAYDDGIWYKYDPVNDEWFDYSEFIDFSDDRKIVYLTLTDGGFGDADGIENGIIVDPLALRTATDHSSGSESFVEDLAGKVDPSGMCFISAADSRSADRQPLSLWREIRSRELLIVFILMMLAYCGKEIFLRIKQYRRLGRRTSLMEGWRDS